jgi:tetratricopeptide (TPR) repeat protein
MTTTPGSEPPRQPPRWEWVASAVSVAGAAGVEVLANRVSNLGWVTWPSLGLAGVWIVALSVRQIRGLRALERAAAEPAPSVPAQPPGGSRTLPYTSGFTGRDEDLLWLVDALSTEHAVAVVGRRGVGTSSCAVQAANLIQPDFPHGQIYLDLRAAGRRLGARQVLAALARVAGTPPPRSRRPAALTEAANRLHDRLDDQHLLLVLDNVDDPAQVWPLLPHTSRCRLLMAGAPALAHLDGVASRWLAEPGEPDAIELFAAAGQAAPGASRRVDVRTDPAVAVIVELCGRQPSAIRALGYRMARHGWRSGDLLATLRHAVAAPAHHRVPLAEALTLLTDRDVAYAALSPAARRMFRLLSLAPEAVDRATIAALCGLSASRLGRLLDELATGAFVVGAPGDRYEIRPLLVSYARLHLRRAESTRRRIAAQVRLLSFLARRAERHAASLSMTGLYPAGTTPADRRDAALAFDDDPYGWFELHGDLLRAVVEDIPGVPSRGAVAVAMPRRVRYWWFRLAVALCGWYARENRLDEWAEVCRIVLAAPTADARSDIAGWAHNELGVLRRRRGDPQGAAAALTLALAQRGRRGTAQARMNLGLALLDLGHVEDAIEHLELARRHRSHADRGGHALTDLALGAAYLAQDEPNVAHRHLVRAANTFRATGESRGYAAALTNLVLAQSRLGEHLDAAQSWTAALREYDTLTDPTGRASALLNAGAAMLTSAPGRAERAYELLYESLRLREQGRPTAGLGRTLLYLGDAAHKLDRPDEAREHWARAAEVCAAVGDIDGTATASRRPEH